MATRFYLRDTTSNTSGYARTEKSTAMTATDDSGNGAWDLDRAAGSTQQSSSNATVADTNAHQDFMGKWISEALVGVGSLAAQTWTLRLAAIEGNNFANMQLAFSLYVLKSDDTVRGFVYDSATALGPAEVGTSETGYVISLSGSAVSGVLDTDRLCLEVWVVATQGMGTSYTNQVYFNGTDNTFSDGAAVSSAGSYVETPDTIFPPSITSAAFVDGGRNWSTPYQDIDVSFSEAVIRSGGAYSVGATISGLTVSVNGGAGQALTYRAGDNSATWTVRLAQLLHNGDVVTLSYDRTTGEIFESTNTTEIANVSGKATTNSLTKRIRATLKRGDTGAVITTAVDMAVCDAEPRDSDDGAWFTVLQRHPNVTPDGSGIVDVQATDSSLVVGDPIYLAIFNPREDATTSSTYARTTVSSATVT